MSRIYALLSCVALAACGEPEPSPSQVIAGVGSAFCDGSTDIKLGIWTGGGSICGFSCPLGYEFAFVDGTCTYFASIHPAKGVATGVLDAATATQLARDIAYTRIGELSSHKYEPCFEASPTLIADGQTSFACGCGCDESSAPPEIVAADAAAHRWIYRLFENASGPVAAVRAAALKDDNGPYADAPVWPLNRPIDDILERTWTIGWDDAGKVIDAAGDVDALRGLRELFHARGTGMYVVVGQQQYTLQARDELPAEDDKVVRAFLNMHRQF